MQHFKFKNWRIGGMENSIFDVTNRAKVNIKAKVLDFFGQDDKWVFLDLYLPYAHHHNPLLIINHS